MKVGEYVIYNYSHFRKLLTPYLGMLTDTHLKFVEIQQNSSTFNCFSHWQG